MKPPKDLDPKLEQFKHLLEYFVSHIEYVTNYDTSFVGYNQYIKPHIDAGDFQEKGFGHKAGSLFSKKTIAAWNDFGNGNVVNITVDSRFNGATTRGVFLHWWNGYSVKANWKLDADTRESHVISLIICFKNDPAEKEASLEALGWTVLPVTARQLYLSDGTDRIVQALRNRLALRWREPQYDHADRRAALRRLLLKPGALRPWVDPQD